MKHIHFYFIFIFITSCGPELQTIINRDQYNRIILKAELKGEADTLWSNTYTYHDILNNNIETDTLDNDLSVNSSGNLTWGEEPEITTKAQVETLEITLNDSLVIPSNVDTTKKSFSSFIKNKAEGQWTTWHPNGTRSSTSFYKKGKLEGLNSDYNNLDVLIKEETYTKGQLNGLASYYDSLGVLIKTKTFMKGQLTGVVKEFLDGKILISEKSFKKDSLNGLWSLWHSNGELNVIKNYKNGSPIGNWIFNNDKSDWIREEQYKKGLAHGIWSFYDSTEVKVYQYYTNGELIAEYNEAKWPNGQIKETPSFKNGLPNGTWTGYWPDGSTMYTLNYKNGEKHGSNTKYDSLGVLIYEVEFDKGKKGGTEKYFYPNGTIKRTAKYTSGNLNGKTELFDNEGIKLETLNYKDSLKTGDHIYWWPNSEKHKVFIYENSILNGKYEEWDSLGTDIIKGLYTDGKQNKKWLYFDKRGNREKIIFIRMDSIITNYSFKYYENLQIKEEPNFNDEGIFDGKFKAFHDGGETLKTYAYTNGLKIGIWLSYFKDKRRNVYQFYKLDTLITDYSFKYYENLQIKEEPNFNDEGIYHNKWENFFLNGMSSKTFNYLDGKLSGLSTSIWDSTYNKQSESIYANDTLNGNYLEWYLDSKQKEDGNYKIGKKDLLWTYWNEFGERRFEEWREGVLFDSFEYEYYPNGQVKEEPSYENGRKHGDWVRYFQDGTVRGLSVYKEGFKDGLWIDYNRPEQIAFQGKYKKDIKIGKWEWFWLNRAIMSKVTYENGNITFEECYNRADGSKRDCSKVFGPDDIYFKNE